MKRYMCENNIAKYILSEKRCSSKASKSLQARIRQIRYACPITKQRGKSECNYFFFRSTAPTSYLDRKKISIVQFRPPLPCRSKYTFRVIAICIFVLSPICRQHLTQRTYIRPCARMYVCITDRHGAARAPVWTRPSAPSSGG